MGRAGGFFLGRKCGPTRGKGDQNILERGEGMSCAICSRANDSIAFSLLGFAVCQDCESWLMCISPDDAEYESAVQVFKDVWDGFLAGRSFEDVLQENTVGG